MQRFEYRQVRMGVEARIVVYAPDEARALEACRAAYHRISQLEAKMSDYRPDSELMQLCQRAVNRWVRVSRELFYVLWRAQNLAAQTAGAFDITIGPLVLLWREAGRTKQLPDEATLNEAKARVGWQKLILSKRRRAAQLARAGMRLDLGGIAKGYACDEALRTLTRFGIRRALVQMGGDLVVGDPPPDQPGWRIELPGLDGQEQTLLLRRRALSTSGSTEQYVEIGGKRYAHIIDPRTGLGLTHLTLARVQAPDGITADSLATAACVMGAEAIDRLKRLYPHTTIEVQTREFSPRGGDA
jgi:thiamine biosynthesis lipoprotein